MNAPAPPSQTPCRPLYRIACIWLPDLPVERWETRQADGLAGPVALVSEGARGLVVEAVNGQARAGGVRPGQRLADARALCPGLAGHPFDAAGDTAHARQLALRAQLWSPFTTVLDPPHAPATIALNVTGAAHLFGGEEAMLADMQRRLARQGHRARVAIADTLGAAVALAWMHSEGLAVAAPGATLAAIGPLPAAALRIDGATALLLRRLGLKTVAALAALPRTALARRFRSPRDAFGDPLRRLDEALGRRPERVAPLVARPLPAATAQVMEPVRHAATLGPVLDRLADDLAAALLAEGAGARVVRFRAWRVDGHVATVTARLALPSRDAAHVRRLLADRVAALDAGFGFDAFRLDAPAHEPLAGNQPGLMGERDEAAQLARLVDRLSERFGAAHVRSPVPRASHVPERAVAWGPPLDGQAPGQPLLPFHDRPQRLLERPEPIAVVYATPEGLPRRFRWRRRTHDVAKVEGPERIAPEWWRERGHARLRDYYKVEDAAGARFWIYRLGLAGDGRGEAPGWFLHGLFA